MKKAKSKRVLWERSGRKKDGCSTHPITIGRAGDPEMLAPYWVWDDEARADQLVRWLNSRERISRVGERREHDKNSSPFHRLG